MARTLKKKIKPSKRGGARPKKKTLKKQKGGSIALIAGGIVAISAAAASAFAGYKYMNMIKERSKIRILLSQVGDIEYLPRYAVIGSNGSKNLIKQYLQCVSNSEFIDILRSKPDILKTVTIQNVLTTISSIDPELVAIRQMLEKNDPNFKEKLTINTSLLEYNYSDPLLSELKLYLLATAKVSKSPATEYDESMKLAKSRVNWVNIIYEGGTYFDPMFDSAVETILRERGSDLFVDSSIKEMLSNMKDNYYLNECINRKMEECTRNPRGYLDYIKNNITWDSSKRCLACPQEDCLIYIYDYYYSFLKQKDSISILQKLYILMLCEARICVLSKCIVLEGLRQQSGDKSNVIRILKEIYKRDKKDIKISAVVPEKYADLTTDKTPTMEKEEIDYNMDFEDTQKSEITVEDILGKKDTLDLGYSEETSDQISELHDTTEELYKDYGFKQSGGSVDIEPKLMERLVENAGSPAASESGPEAVPEATGGVPGVIPSPDPGPDQAAPGGDPSGAMGEGIAMPEGFPKEGTGGLGLGGEGPGVDPSGVDLPGVDPSGVALPGSGPPGVNPPEEGEGGKGLGGLGGLGGEEAVGGISEGEGMGGLPKVEEPAPGDLAPGGSVPEGPVPEGPVPGDLAPEDLAPEDLAPEGPVPGDLAPEDPVPGGPVPEGSVPGDLAPGDLAPEGPVPGDLAPEGPKEEEPKVDLEPESMARSLPDELVTFLSSDLEIYMTSIDDNLKMGLSTKFTDIIEDKTHMKFKDSLANIIDRSAIGEGKELDSMLKSLFPLLTEVIVSNKKYMDNPELIQTFNLFYELYCNFPELFSFISPWTIGKFFFELDELREDKTIFDYDLRRTITVATELQSNRNIPVTKFLAYCFLGSRNNMQSFTKEDKEGPCHLNKVNLTYLQENDILLEEFVSELVHIYTKKPNVEIEKLLTELFQTDPKNKLIGYFSENSLFMKKITDNKELYGLFAKLKITGDIEDKKPLPSEEESEELKELKEPKEPDKKILTQSGRVTCERETRNLMNTINNEEEFAFGKQQALLLEFCSKAMSNLEKLMGD